MMATILVVHETASRASFLGPRRVCLVQEMRIFCGRFATNTDEYLHDRSGETDGSDDTEEHQGHARTVETN